MSEADLAQLIKLIVSIPGIGGTAFLVIKTAANYWFKKQAELEKLKQDLQTKETELLQEKIACLKQTVQEHQAALETHALALANNGKQNQTLISQVNVFAERTSHALTEYARLTHERLTPLENFNMELRTKLQKSETIKIGKESIMIKDKKD